MASPNGRRSNDDTNKWHQGQPEEVGSRGRDNSIVTSHRSIYHCRSGDSTAGWCSILGRINRLVILDETWDITDVGVTCLCVQCLHHDSQFQCHSRSRFTLPYFPTDWLFAGSHPNLACSLRTILFRIIVQRLKKLLNLYYCRHAKFEKLPLRLTSPWQSSTTMFTTLYTECGYSQIWVYVRYLLCGIMALWFKKLSVDTKLLSRQWLFVSHL